MPHVPQLCRPGLLCRAAVYPASLLARWLGPDVRYGLPMLHLSDIGAPGLPRLDAMNPASALACQPVPSRCYCTVSCAERPEGVRLFVQWRI